MSALKKDLPTEISRENAKKNVPRRMLLVEDVRVAQIMIKTFVDQLGFELDIANNGTEAVALFEPGKYSVIWLDIGLPDFDGYEVARRMREAEKGTNFSVLIIGVSAHASEDPEFNAKKGLNAMFIKPLPTERAKELLRSYGIL